MTDEEKQEPVQAEAPKTETAGNESPDRITVLEAKKAELIERIKKAYRRIRYKKYEQKALEPFLEQTKDVQIAPYRKMKRAIEFKISTSAYTPQMERNLLKQMKGIEKQLDEVKEVERARRKAKYVVQDIADAEKEITDIEAELKVIREELKKLYDSQKSARFAAKKQAAIEAKAEEDMVALGDLALIEKE